uniref:Uncharacterized protein n=1 Tax=Paramormyrops kingsleyae TaxID=1676925 RepID=A0A3B3RRL9_9TELE
SGRPCKFREWGLTDFGISRKFMFFKIIQNSLSFLTLPGSAGSDSNIITHYVALGRPAFIQLINGASGYELTLRKDGNQVFRFKKDDINFQENWGSQFNFYTNGTLMIIKAERSLSGIYTLEVFHLNGTNIPSERFLLIIEGKLDIYPLCNYV